MGTNYYHRTNICECCGRSETEHIGKSSCGWQFSFHSTDKAQSFEDWKVLLKTGEIRDEYGDLVTYEEFIGIVTQKQIPQNRNHASLYPGDSYCDLDGYSFTRSEFS
jgi:hypothetical protein